MENYQIYIRRVLKQVHPDSMISSESLDLLNELTNVLGMKIGHQAKLLAHPINYKDKKIKDLGKKTISSRDIQSAVRLILTKELAKHAISQGTRAVTKFSSSQPGTKDHPISVDSRSGLQLSISRTDKILRKNTTFRIGETAAIYLTAVLEYIAAELLELSGNLCKDEHKSVIKPLHIKKIVEDDEELASLVRDLKVVLPGYENKDSKKLLGSGL